MRRYLQSVLLLYIYVALLRLADVPVNKLWVVCKQKCEETCERQCFSVCVCKPQIVFQCERSKKETNAEELRNNMTASA